MAGVSFDSVADNFTSICSHSYTPTDHLSEKFLLVGVLGTSICVLGMGLNGLAIYLLGRLTWKSPSPLIYLFVLANLDFLFMWLYILMASIQIFYDYFESITLYHWWNNYIPVVFALGKITQTASTYLLVVASIERFMDVGGFFGAKLICTSALRIIVILAVLLFATLFRGISYWELNVYNYPECEGFASLFISQSELVRNDAYAVFYGIYAVNFLQVFLPFCLLLVLNCGILYRIRSALTRQTVAFQRQSAWECSSDEENLRSATKMLISVISTYLISNILSVVITSIEQMHKTFLTVDHPVFYTFSVDCINILYVLTSTIRLIIYVGCSEKIRAELVSLVRRSGRTRQLPTDPVEMQLITSSLAKPLDQLSADYPKSQTNTHGCEEKTFFR